jgi:cytochrome c peroxidase
MHDGRFPSLEAVLDHYFSLGNRAIRYDARLPRTPLDMQQRADLIAFLGSLTDEAFVGRFALTGPSPGNPDP